MPRSSSRSHPKGLSGEAIGRVDQVIASIGPKLKQLRTDRGLSLQQLGDRAGVSAAAIHKLERNGMVPTVGTLMKLAAALGEPVGHFIDSEGEDRSVVLITPDDRMPIFTSKKGLRLEGISGPYQPFNVAGAIATVSPGANSGPRPMRHAGEELVYVLRGTLEFEVDGQEFLLRPRHALHFLTSRPHRWRNPAAAEARAVWLTLRPG